MPANRLSPTPVLNLEHTTVKIIWPTLFGQYPAQPECCGPSENSFSFVAALPIFAAGRRMLFPSFYPGKLAAARAVIAKN